MKALLTYSSFPTYEWEIDENFNPEIIEINTLEDMVKVQSNHNDSSIIMRKPYGKFNDYCDMIIEIYDDYRE